MTHDILQAASGQAAVGLSFSSQLIERIGWVLVHSLWQFSVIALVGFLIDRMLKRRSSAMRYVTLLSGLMLMAAASVVTWRVIPERLDTNSRADLLNAGVERPAIIDQHFAPDAAGGLADALPALTPPTGSPVPEKTVAAVDMTSIISADASGEPESLMARLSRLVAPWLGVIVGVWSCGVLLFSIRPVWSWCNVQRLRTVDVSPVTESVQQALKRIKQKLQIRRRVQLLQSTLVPAPVVVGCFQSVILLPTSFISGVPVSQLEAILAHELAHVRRYDYLVNLLQTLAETLFFYHPAVWWVSHRIRIERENCCDDLVVAVLGNKVEYGRALLAVEEFRSAAVSTLALSAKGGSLLARVKRLFVDPAQDDRSSAGLAALGIVLAMITAAGFWSTVIDSVDGATKDNASFGEETFGPESRGLQFRLVALSPDVNDNAPDLNTARNEWTRSADMTFGVELKNVSKEPLTLAGIRYGDSFAKEVQGTLRTEMIAPHWFEFDFTDMDGKPIPRTHREFYHQWSVVNSSSTQELTPGQSLIEILRPAKFNAPMDYDLPPGTYQVQARYHGPDDEFRENVRKHWPDKAILNAWPHEVVSNFVEFEVKQPSRRTAPEDLIWGQPVHGLRAALEYRLADDVTGNPLEAPGVPVGTSIGVVFHLKNVSDKPISFISETGRQGDFVNVVNERGEKVEVPDAFFTGWPIDVSWQLEPGEIAQLQLLTPGLSSLDQPGRYTVRYTVRFNSRQQKDEVGNVIFPRPGDYDKEIDTGDTPLFLHEVTRDVAANGEIHGRLLDDETGEPIRDAVVACGAVINDSRKGGGANTKTDSMGNYRLVVPSPGIYNVWLKEYRRSSGTAAADDGILVEAGKVASSELRLTRGRWIKGKVIDREGKPVSQIVVSSYSAARPQSGGVQSIRTKQDGTFLFTLPPGRVHVYTQHQVPTTDENPFGLGLRADAFVDLSGSTREETITLTLGTAESKFGADDWLKRSTPGTLILSHDNKADVTGIVVDPEGKPLSNVQVFKEDGEIVRTDEQGKFTYPIDKGTQFVMHAFHPGWHIWFGTPTAGDELKVVLEKKAKSQQAASTADQSVDSQGIGVLKPAAPEIKLADFLNVMAVSFTDDSNTLWSVSTKDDVRFRSWDAATQQKTHEVKLDSDKHGNMFLSSELTLSPDRTRVVGVFEGKVCLWDSKTGKLVKVLALPQEHQHSMLNGLSFSADFSRIAAGMTSGLGGRISPDSYAVVWDVTSGEVLQTVELTGAVQTHCTALSADGRWLAAGGQQAGLRIWEVATGRLVHSIANSNPDLQHPDPEVKAPGTDQVLSLMFSPDGKLLAMADLLTVKLFDTESGALERTINRSFRYGKSGVVFSPDGQLLARVDADKTVPIWSTQSGELVAEFPTAAHDGSFSPDGRWFAACLSDDAQGIGLWRLRQAAEPKPKPNAQEDDAATDTQTGTFRGRIVVAVPPDLPKLRVPPANEQRVLLRLDATEEERKEYEASLVEIDDKSLIVGEDNGLANAFVYLRKAPAGWKASMPQQSAALITVEEYAFSPRALLFRAGQDLECVNPKKSPDTLYTSPDTLFLQSWVNPRQNRLVVPGKNLLLSNPFPRPEPRPVLVTSNVHVWKLMYLLALDHPFAAITDSDGRFQIDGLPPGEHEFWIFHERGGALEKKLKVNISAGKTTRLDKSYPGDRFVNTGAERGNDNASTPRQTGDTPVSKSSRVFDAQGRPVAGAKIEFSEQIRYAWLEKPTVLGIATTDDQGRFEYPEALPDDKVFYVYVTADGFQERFWSANQQVFRRIDGIRQPDTLTLFRPATVSGIVIGADGQPLTDAEIAIDYFMDNGPAVINGNRVKTDKDGRFEATNVPPANVFVRFESPYASPADVTPVGQQSGRLIVEPLIVNDGAKIQNVVLDLRKAVCRIEGIIVDHEDKGVAGSLIRATAAAAGGRLDESIRVKSDKEGRFRFNGLAPADYVIGTETPGLTQTVTVSLDTATEVRLTTYVSGRKTSPDNLSATVWGAPNKDGLVVGLKLTPDKPSYAFGDVILAEIFVRNPTSEIQSYEISFSMQGQLNIVDSDEAIVAHLNYGHFTGIPYTSKLRLPPDHEAVVGSFRFGLTEKGNNQTSPPLATFHVGGESGKTLTLQADLLADIFGAGRNEVSHPAFLSGRRKLVIAGK